MAIKYDFHIHSCLSPCGSDDMTPANIAGMSFLAQLDAIAVTDHNSGLNIPAAAEAAKRYGIKIEGNFDNVDKACCKIWATPMKKDDK